MRNLISILILIGLFSTGTLAARCIINEDMVFVIDGKKVFPIGFTMPPPPDGKTPAGKNAIDELHDAGATFLRTGVMATNWDEATFDLQQKWLDAAGRNGMYVVFNLREASSIDPKKPKSEELLRKIIAKFKDHPALACWKGIDEPQWGKHPIEPMVNAYKLIKQLDPDHPLWVNHAPRGEIEDLRPYNITLDITGADIYPIGYPPGTHSLRPNKQMSMVGDYTRLMIDVAENKKPVCMVLQIAWSGVIKEGKTLRFPSFAEERFMTYQSIINGSRGLLYFGGHIGKACTPEDAKLGWNWTFWNRVLRPVIEEIGDKSPLYPALTAPNSKLPIKCTGEGMEFLVRETNDSVFILACKREGPTIQAKFTGLPTNFSTAEVLYESPRTVEAKNGTFTDWFAPFDVHVYSFRK
ncbi:MAG TPA: hypothetical protein VGQ99_15335 [Tepidisphaeraceae bacterium]|jgi:hypothetical protein|nr:hypothetical protein [Tepidisphaeraceae bacterium]